MVVDREKVFVASVPLDSDVRRVVECKDHMQTRNRVQHFATLDLAARVVASEPIKR
jgi:hypothetical protein